MSYKVNYYTLAIMKDETYGNIKQESGTFYTDTEIDKIPNILDRHLKPKKRVGVVTKIEKVKGVCIFE